MYESPIDIIYGEMETQLEGEILKATQRVGVNVNKEELLKALQYDREQYSKGYKDGLNAAGWTPCSERLPEESGEYLVWYDCGYGTENPSDDDEKGCMVVNFDAGVGDFGYWHDEYDSYTLGFLDSEFIYFETAVAWMKLPEPYKGE